MKSNFFKEALMVYDPKTGKTSEEKIIPKWNTSKRKWESLGDMPKMAGKAGKAPIYMPRNACFKDEAQSKTNRCQIRVEDDGTPIGEPNQFWQYSNYNESRVLRKKIIQEIKSLLNEAPVKTGIPPEHQMYIAKMWQMLKPYDPSGQFGDTATDAVEEFRRAIAQSVDSDSVYNDFFDPKRTDPKVRTMIINALGKFPANFTLVGSPGDQTGSQKGGGPGGKGGMGGGTGKGERGTGGGGGADDGTTTGGGGGTDPLIKTPGAFGCRKPQFIGKNGKRSGDQIINIQMLLGNLAEVGLRVGDNSVTFQGASKDNLGYFGLATQSAVVKFQEMYGERFAPKLKGQLGIDMPTIKADGCVGPRTACALILSAELSGLQTPGFKNVLGYNPAKCKAVLSGAKKKAKTSVTPDKTTVPASGMGGGAQELPPEPGPERVGGREIPAPMQESKNWLDRTREETASNLFERLVKDAAKKVI